jgi:four helix bundle protein
MAGVPIRDSRDLVAWQQAIELALACDLVCDALPRRAWHLASQMRRAANSIHSSIAEGNGRPSTADYLRHLGMSNASLRELESDLHFIRRRYPNLPGIREALVGVPRVSKTLSGLVRSLRRKLGEE